LSTLVAVWSSDMGVCLEGSLRLRAGHRIGRHAFRTQCASGRSPVSGAVEPEKGPRLYFVAFLFDSASRLLGSSRSR
jgi:hypothetical protein